MFSRIYGKCIGIDIPVPWSLLGNGIKSVNLLRIRYQLPIWMRTLMRDLFTEECFDKLKTHQLLWNKMLKNWTRTHTHKQTKVLSCSMAACAFLEKNKRPFKLFMLHVSLTTFQPFHLVPTAKALHWEYCHCCFHHGSHWCDRWSCRWCDHRWVLWWQALLLRKNRWHQWADKTKCHRWILRSVLHASQGISFGGLCPSIMLFLCGKGSVGFMGGVKLLKVNMIQILRMRLGDVITPKWVVCERLWLLAKARRGTQHNWHLKTAI